MPPDSSTGLRPFSRRPRITRASATRWLATASLVLLALANLAVAWPRTPYGDFGVFYAAGRAYDGGLNPYTKPSEVLPDISTEAGPNANPPVSLLLFVPLSRLPRRTAAWLLYGVSLPVYALCVFVVARRPGAPVLARRAVWALAMTAPWYTLSYGQIYILLLPLLVGAWYALAGGRRVLAGLLLGVLIAVKPNLAIWPGLLLLAGHFAVAAVAVLAMAAVWLLAAAVLGPGVYAQWLAAGKLFAVVTHSLPFDMSVLSLTARLGVPWAGMPLDVLLLCGAAFLVWRRRPPMQRIGELAILAALLVAPRAWVGYVVFLLPLLLRKRWSPLKALSAGLFLVPVWLVVMRGDQGGALSWLWGSLYAVALLLLFVDVIMRDDTGSGEGTALAPHLEK